MNILFKNVSDEMLSKITKLFYAVVTFVGENSGNAWLALNNIERVISGEEFPTNKEKFYDGFYGLVAANILTCNATYSHYEHKEHPAMKYEEGLAIAKRLGFKIVDAADVAILATGCVCCETEKVIEEIRRILSRKQVSKLVIIHHQAKNSFWGHLAYYAEKGGIDVNKIVVVNDMLWLGISREAGT